MSLLRWTAVVGIVAALSWSGRCEAAEESWQPLMDRAPADANVLLMVHADKVRSSGFAKTSGWNSAEAATGGMRSLLHRDEVRRAVFAARLNLGDLSPNWEPGVIETKSAVTLTSFAAEVRSPHEMLGATTAVRLPIDAYLLQFSPQMLGLLGPADRQKAVQWARSSARNLESAYLTKIAEFPETVGTEIMLGIDLTDAADVNRVRSTFAESPVLREAKIDPGTAAQIVPSIQGMALGVRVLDQASGMIRIDFAADPSALSAVMKPLLLERLAARGLMIEDFRSWTPDIQGKTVYVGGKLTPVGLSLLLSLVEPELPSNEVAAASSGPALTSGTPATVMVEKSRQHFMKTKNLITEVRFPSSDLKIVSAGAFGAWIDRQARRIDMLPILDVDPELLDYSQGVAQSLRVTAGKQRGATISASASSNRRTRYTDYNNQTYVTESENQIQSRMETAAANLSHVEVMRMIDDETAAIRRRLTERYRVEF